MTCLRGKRVLMLAPMGQYSEAITKALLAMGAVVDCYEERPALNVLAKILIRYFPRLIRSHAQAYFDGIVKETMSNNYDFVLMIRAEAVTRQFIRDLKSRHRNAVIILYQWDSMTLTKGPVDKLGLFDRVFSFDKRDCEKYSLTFLPLFYMDDYKTIARSGTEPKHDFMFVGTIHSDRYEFIKQIARYAQARSMSNYLYLFIPNPVVFYKLKYIDKNLRGAARAEFKYVPLGKSETVQAVANSRMVIDAEHPAQLGLTMRTIEMLGAGRKLITTNADILNYDFYHPNNILVVNRKRVEIPDSFIEAEYVEVEPSVYEKYGVHHWVTTVFQPEAGRVIGSKESTPAHPRQ